MLLTQEETEQYNKQYREEKIEQSREYHKQYNKKYREEHREANQEYHKEYNKKYYQANKAEIIEKYKQKIECEACKKILSKCSMYRHMKICKGMVPSTHDGMETSYVDKTSAEVVGFF
jgi:hypothetical protein